MYFIQKNINKIYNGDSTFFLNPKELLDVGRSLKKNSYNIFIPYPDSEKNIIYTSRFPNVNLYKLNIKNKVRHQDILGAMYSLNIDDSLFGDIVIYNNQYYIYVLDIISNYFENNLIKVANNNVDIEKINLDYLKDYHRDYEDIKVIVSSLRVDTVISRVIKTNRDSIKDLIKNKAIIHNYELLKSPSNLVKDGDVFSIRKYGKYKFVSVIKETKKDNYLILIKKYL